MHGYYDAVLCICNDCVGLLLSCKRNWELVMVFILGLLLMWCEYIHRVTDDDNRFVGFPLDGYWVIGLLGRIMCSVSLIHFAWFVLL